MNFPLKFIVWFNGGEIYFENGKQYVQLKKVMGMGRTGWYTMVNYEVRYFLKIPILFPVSFSN